MKKENNFFQPGAEEHDETTECQQKVEANYSEEDKQSVIISKNIHGKVIEW